MKNFLKKHHNALTALVIIGYYTYWMIKNGLTMETKEHFALWTFVLPSLMVCLSTLMTEAEAKYYQACFWVYLKRIHKIKELEDEIFPLKYMSEKQRLSDEENNELTLIQYEIDRLSSHLKWLKKELLKGGYDIDNIANS